MEALLEIVRLWLIGTLYMLPGLVIGFTMHEFTHVAVAYALGDSTQRSDGRLTLNPSAHIDWVGFVTFILLGWGYGRSVTVLSNNVRGGRWGIALVYTSGMLANLVLAALFYALWRYLPDGVWSNFLLSGCSCNLVLFFLNLLPITPLDGLTLLSLALPQPVLGYLLWMRRYGYIVLLVLSLFNILDWYLGVTQTFALMVFGAIMG